MTITQYTFNPFLEKVGQEAATAEEIQNEPMLYGYSIFKLLCHYRDHPLAHRILTQIMEHPKFSALVYQQALRGYHPVIDTKSVLLMKGQYPCIPGWHCDGVIRSSADSQPNLDTLDEPIMHFICTITEEDLHIPTLVVDESVTMNIDTTKVWYSVDRGVQAIRPSITVLDNGGIYQFNRATIHKGTSAEHKAWRFFFRLSFYHMPCMEEIRKQVQVYTTTSLGW